MIDKPTMRPKKRSLTLNGHRTSVSLEDEFWDAFCEIAADKGKAINRLAAEIDGSRSGDAGLASTIRLFVLRHFRDKADFTPVDERSTGFLKSVSYY